MSSPSRRLRKLETRVAVLIERLRGAAAELKLQAVEYERRLGDLNHAHDKQVADQATYVSGDKYEGFQTEVRSALASLQGRASGLTSARTLFFEILSLIIASVALAAVLWSRS